MNRAAAWVLCACPLLYFVALTIGLSIGYRTVIWPFSAEGTELLRSYMAPLLLQSLLPLAAIVILLVIFLALGVRQTRNPSSTINTALTNGLACLLLLPPIFLVVSSFQADLLTGSSWVTARANLDSWRAYLFQNDTRAGRYHPLLWSTGIAWIASILLAFREAIGLGKVSWRFVRPENLMISLGYAVALTTLTFGVLFLAPVLRSLRKGHCLTCGYDLTGIKNKCPECGTEFTPQTS